jgi:hypothetical protein
VIAVLSLKVCVVAELDNARWRVIVISKGVDFMNNNSRSGLPKLSNREDYPLLREYHGQLLHGNPFARYGVQAIGIGRKSSRGKMTDRLAIRFYVVCKIPRSQIPYERRIPKSPRFYSHKYNREVTLLTDVIETSPGDLHMADPESVVRPVPGGVSCSSMQGGNGTIGGWVWDNTDDTIVMLSNRHVFGDSIGSPIIQPGTVDGGVFPQDRIGEVKRIIPLIPWGGRQTKEDCNYVDAAIGEVDSSALIDATVLEIGPAVCNIDNPEIDMVVEKFGQTTGHTVGMIEDVDIAVALWVEGVQVAFCDIMYIATDDPGQLPLESFGDSGALVFQQGEPDGPNIAVGLLFGGGTGVNNPWYWACNIVTVFESLDLSPLCPAACSAFINALARERTGGGESVQFVTGDSGGSLSPGVFTTKERRMRRSWQLNSGLANDLRKRVLTSQRGRGLMKFIDLHRNELSRLIMRDGDTRRALIAALRPIFRGAITTTDVLEHRMTEDDIARLDKLGAVVAGKGSDPMRESLKVLQGLLGKGKGRTVAEILKIKE